MRAGIAFALLVLACSMGSYLPAFAQHHGSKETAQKPKTDAELIASAMSAGPLAVSKDATVVAVGSDGKLRTLRQGQGALWGCDTANRRFGPGSDIVASYSINLVGGRK